MIASVRCKLTRLECFFQARNLSGRNFPPSHLEASNANLNFYLITSGGGNFPQEYCFNFGWISEWLFLMISASVNLRLLFLPGPSVLTSDELLPILAFLIVKSNTRNWWERSRGKAIGKILFYEFLVANFFHFLSKDPSSYVRLLRHQKAFRNVFFLKSPESK